MTDDYAPLYLDGGGDPSFRQIDAFLRAHFNAHAEYNGAEQPASHSDLDRALTASGFPSTVEQPASHSDQRAAIDYAVHLMEEAFEGAAPVHAVAIRRHIEVITSLSEQPAPPLAFNPSCPCRECHLEAEAEEATWD